VKALVSAADPAEMRDRAASRQQDGAYALLWRLVESALTSATWLARLLVLPGALVVRDSMTAATASVWRLHAVATPQRRTLSGLLSAAAPAVRATRRCVAGDGDHGSPFGQAARALNGWLISTVCPCSVAARGHK
jgi:hypothetical protein